MMDRRAFVGCGAAGLIACAESRGEYFGSTAPPPSERLVHTLAAEVETLDPAMSTGSNEFYVIPALFEGLTQYHPELPILMAALATHYETNADYTQFRFYLRGHPAPRGLRLPDSADLPDKFSRGRKRSATGSPAYWSDGTPITAHDFVYSWRRFVDPRTAAPMSYYLLGLKNAEEIIAGKRRPEALGVRAQDEFTFVVELRSPTSFFVESVTSYIFAAVPRHAVEAARRRNAESTWTEPSHIVTSGPFTLREYRRYDRIVLVRNRRYYDAPLVGLDEVTFLPIVNGAAVMNLYKAGQAAVTPGISLSPLYTPVLSRKKDYHSTPGFGTVFPCISTRRVPFDNVLLRYALNMATEKKAITDFLGSGNAPARTLVPHLLHYTPPSSLPVEVDGRTYDVLSFDVEGARALLAKAGFRGGIGHNGSRLEVPCHFPMLPETPAKSEILQQQWLKTLNVAVRLFGREFNVHWRMVMEADYTGVADYAVFPLYFDPNGLLGEFATASNGNNPAGGRIQAMLPRLGRPMR